MTDENPFATPAGATIESGGGGGIASSPFPSLSGGGGGMPSRTSAVSTTGAMLTFSNNQWRLATGKPYLWILFSAIDIICSVIIIADGILMQCQVYGDDNIDMSNTVYLQTIVVGVYFIIFGVMSLVCSIGWLSLLGKFIGFFYFMWGRGIAYIVMGTMSLNTPWKSVSDNPPPIVYIGAISQFVIAIALTILGVVYVICGFVPGVSVVYRPILGGQRCRKSYLLVTTREYWLGREKFNALVSTYAR
jgi:hypothetical protein